jgi:hypothetical protein
MTDRAFWANTWHQHLTEQARIADNTVAVAVLELHKPDERGDCSGCESEGYESEQPDYGCATVKLIADAYGLFLEMICPVCGSHQRTLTSGGPVGHRRRDGDMWLSCPGSTEVLEALPWRSEAEVMADFTQRLTAQMATATERMETALGIVPPAIAVHAVTKWAHQVHVRAAMFGE